ncbi:S-adenosyl-L-methionine-dependent methyltransferase [Aspergillus pseudoustus]|uniref:S-adenosyl-L-methionine-dependent methyltransferase n=1 Tax=Aspergillus pseudoustus TaxID=1810923 RepID=A0ABR4J0Z2_9EURO
MAPIREGEYMIQTNGQSISRLNLQHYWVEETLGYLLHPDIPVADNAKIADIATGTGIWPISLSRRVPSTVQIDGFDITTAMFPPADWLPANVSLRTLDILKPLPDELRGVYDVVCIRYFGVLIRDNDPGFVLRNLVDMLKPGGYIQWVEADIYNQRVVTSAHSTLAGPTTLEQHLEPWRGYLDASGLRYDWLKTLPTTCKETLKMSSAKLYKPKLLPAFRFTASASVLGAWEELSYKFLDDRPDEFLGTGPELRKKIAGFRREVERGAALDLEYYVTVARK